MWTFIRTRYFWLSLLVMAAIILLLGTVFILSLGWFTNHGAAVQVPNLKEMTADKAHKILDEAGLNFEIADSTYESDKKPFEVLKQVPAQGMKVKPGRTIYLTVNAKTPPKVKLPDLKDMSLRQAELVLNNLGLKLGQVTMKQDIAKNAVLEVRSGNKALEIGVMISRGTVIDLVVGSGAQNEEIPVPDLLSITLHDARTILKNVALNIGAVVADRTVKSDTENAMIYKQTPEHFTLDNNTINPGEAVDVFVTKDTLKVNKKLREHILKDNEHSKEKAPSVPDVNNDKNNPSGE